MLVLVFRQLPVCIKGIRHYAETRNTTPTQTALRFKVGFGLTSQVVGQLHLLRPHNSCRFDQCLRRKPFSVPDCPCRSLDQQLPRCEQKATKDPSGLQLSLINIYIADTSKNTDGEKPAVCIAGRFGALPVLRAHQRDPAKVSPVKDTNNL